MRTTDYFPRTRLTWFEEQTLAGEHGRREVNRYVMEIYLEPLKAYIRATSYGKCADATDLVQGFFATRLGRPDYFANWAQKRAEQKAQGKPPVRLRRWLITGLFHHIKETWHDQLVPGGYEPVEEQQGIPHPSAGPLEKSEEAFRKEMVRSIVIRALNETERRCQSKRLERNFQIFLLHHFHRKAYAEIQDILKEPPSRAKGKARTARKIFKAAVRQILIRDGTPPDAVDGEIRDLLH